jgi:FAD/FMN-containing dehydrogenase
MNAAVNRLSIQPSRVCVRVNDVHSKLNDTEVRERIDARNEADVVAAIRRARERNLSLATCGGRHAMGGQQFATNGMLLDMSGLDRVLEFDTKNGLIEIEAGIQWPRLLQAYLAIQEGRKHQWGIRQKQTGADRLSIGGALAANIHGRVLTNKPIIEDIVSFRIIDAEGRLLNCSREENADLFRLVIGGYGLFGVIVSVTMQLVPRQKMQRIVGLRTLDELCDSFADRIKNGFQYGDLQFVTDEKCDDFLNKGIFSCYRPVPNDTPIPDGQSYMTERGWQDLLHLAHVDKSRAFDTFSKFYLNSSKQIYWSDTHQFTTYLDDYHSALDKRLCGAHPGSEMITELYVPAHKLSDFMDTAKETLRSTGADLIYGTIRLIKEDDESFLSWAKQDFVCVIFNLHVEHTERGIAKGRNAFLGLIDDALHCDGSFFLTYHRHASREQVSAAYPQFAEFLREKQKRDPHAVFASDWYHHYVDVFGE